MAKRKARAAKYRRISEDREGRELGITRQDEDLDALAQQRGLTVVADYFDNDIGASTRSRKTRPGYRQMLADAKAGKFEVIIAYTTGRITRRPREFEDLIDLAIDHGIRFEYVRSPSFDLTTAQGRRVARTLAAQDAGEAEEIAERVARAAYQRARQGLNHGGRRCFGYETDGLRLVPDEAAEVKKVFDSFLAGTPLAKITRDLNARSITTVTGRPWTPETVHDMLIRPRYAGLSEYGGRHTNYRQEIVGKGQWPAIIGEEVHHAVKAILADPKRRTSTGNRASYLLSGIARCGVCGGTIASRGLSGHRRGIRLYRCRKNSCVGRRLDWVDDYVSAMIIAYLSRPEAAELLVDRERPDFPALRQEAHALQIRLDSAAADYADGILTREQLHTITERARARLEEIEALQAHTSRTPVLAGLAGAPDVAEKWAELPLDRRRAVVQAVCAVRILPAKTGKTFNPNKVEIAWKV